LDKPATPLAAKFQPFQEMPILSRSKSSNLDGFGKLQGDAILSDWKPRVTLQTDIPDIPEFLRRHA
jgi:hypothetical protein